ncbi:MAG: alanine racemase [Clostridia bacterium]|nr:alanine racemase [Clostridia bacterium]
METEKFRAWAEIDLDALLGNHRAVKSRLKKKEKICAVVKADAYGHGAVAVAQCLEPETDFFAVAMAEEAFELRNAGIGKPILVLGVVPPARFEELIRKDVRLSLTSLSMAKKAAKAAAKTGKKAIVHLAVDTGMGRIGFIPGPDALRQIGEIAGMKELKIEGIFSHFATADEEDDSFADGQELLFKTFLDALGECGIRPRVRHLYNSAAILRRKPRYDMAREGLILYGLYAQPVKDLLPEGVRPVMSVKARIVQVKTVEAGTPVSYGSTFVTERKTKIATVSMGYGDGLMRALGDGGELLVRGRRAPIVGRVCMDQLMLDVSDVPGVKEGDEATVFGFDGEVELSCAEQAEKCGTISYELLCNVNRRVPRVYIRNGKVVGVASPLPER